MSCLVLVEAALVYSWALTYISRARAQEDEMKSNAFALSLSLGGGGGALSDYLLCIKRGL